MHVNKRDSIGIYLTTAMGSTSSAEHRDLIADLLGHCCAVLARTLTPGSPYVTMEKR